MDPNDNEGNVREDNANLDVMNNNANDIDADANRDEIERRLANYPIPRTPRSSQSPQPFSPTTVWALKRANEPEIPSNESSISFDHFGREYTPSLNGEKINILPSVDLSPVSSPSLSGLCHQQDKTIFHGDVPTYTLKESPSRPFAQGTYGKVFHARRLFEVNEIVIKIGSLASELDRECRNLRKLEAARTAANGAHVVKSFETFHLKDDVKGSNLIKRAIVFESLGPSLTVLRRGVHRSLYDLTDVHIVYIGKQIADGLVFLHGAGLIHVDLKASNILFRTDPAKTGDFTVKIIDMGMSKTVDEERIIYGDGNWANKAPEQLMGFPDTFKSDVWALGCIMAELVMGEVLFPTAPHNVLYCIDDSFPIPQETLARVERRYCDLVEVKIVEGGMRYYQIKTPHDNLFHFRLSPESRMVSADEVLRHMIMRCFELDPVERPSSAVMYKAFYELLE